ncbi:MAG: aminotransferase class V-fold PLP-dependent enzyme [Spirochaetes bacterium]|nr:aminotransferase class V-fold PLP-dependent enzyme [Spirochaetota bacterium]MBU0954064.1 aminotransferase class V-fold PLP-dependent enzyme [Spirochaetota bacterium]
MNAKTTSEGESFSGSPLPELLPDLQKMAAWYLAQESAMPDPVFRTPDAMKQKLQAGLGESGHSSTEVLAGIRRALELTPSSSSWRFLNQLFGGRIGVATVAEMLATLPNSSMYTLKAAGAQVLVENEVLQRMCRMAGFQEGEGCFVPGGSSANLLALLLARDRIAPTIRDHGWQGQQLIAYTSAEAHYSIPKNAGILGLGRSNVRLVPVDPSGAMNAKALASMIETDTAAGLTPFFVNATAGTTVRGAFDPIMAISEVTKKYGVWLHVDGALGGSLILSRTHRSKLQELEQADSFAWNPHKMMGVPLQTSVLLTPKRGTLAASLDETADYLFQADVEEYNPGHRSLQCGRRNDALKLWAAWYHLGDSGWEKRIDRQLQLAQNAAALIDESPELCLVEKPVSINVCFYHPQISSEELCDYLDRKGIMKIGHGQAGSHRAIRLVCVNPDIDESVLKTILETIVKAAKAMLAEGKNHE